MYLVARPYQRSQEIIVIMKKISFAFLVPLLLVLFDVVPPLGRSEPARSAVRFAAAATPQEVLTTITSSSSHRGGAADATGNLVPRELKGKKRTKAPAKKMKSTKRPKAPKTTKRPKAPKTTKRPKAPKKFKSEGATAVLTASPTNKSAASPSSEPTGSSTTVSPSFEPTVKPSFSNEPTVKPSSQPTVKPSSQPTVKPSYQPSGSAQPTGKPSFQPSGSSQPTGKPSTLLDWYQKGMDIDGEAANDQSGYSVSLSSDGTILAIGAFFNDNANGSNSGHVRVWEWKAGAWVQKGADIDGEDCEDRSGTSVSLSSDGLVLAIGAYYNAGINGFRSGHVRVYEFPN